MPVVKIDYEEDEIRALIAEDVERRFGLRPSDHDVEPSINTENHWEVRIEKGQIDASKCDT